MLQGDRKIFGAEHTQILFGLGLLIRDCDLEIGVEDLDW